MSGINPQDAVNFAEEKLKGVYEGAKDKIHEKVKDTVGSDTPIKVAELLATTPVDALEEGEEKDDRRGIQYIHPLYVIKPNLKGLTPEVQMYARFCKASEIAAKQGMRAAQEYISSHATTRAYHIDTELSLPDSLVLVEGQEGIKTNVFDIKNGREVDGYYDNTVYYEDYFDENSVPFEKNTGPLELEDRPSIDEDIARGISQLEDLYGGRLPYSKDPLNDAATDFLRGTEPLGPSQGTDHLEFESENFLRETDPLNRRAQEFLEQTSSLGRSYGTPNLDEDASAFMSRTGGESIDVTRAREGPTEGPTEAPLIEEPVVLPKIVVAARGTINSDLRFTIRDWYSNIQMMLGKESEALQSTNTPLDEFTNQINSTEQQLDKVAEKYGTVRGENGKMTFEEGAKPLLTGYSNGGGTQLYLGEKKGYESITFNSLVGKGTLFKAASKVKHTIYRTTEDIASTMLALGKKKNFTVKAINSRVGAGDPISMHKLSNFTTENAQEVRGDMALTAETFLHTQQQYAEAGIILDLRHSMNEGKTFHEAMLDHFKGPTAGTVTEDGFGPRMNRGSNLPRLWEQMGGKFTQEELEHLDNSAAVEDTDERLKRALTDEQVENLANKSTPELESHLDKMKIKVDKFMRRSNESMRPMVETVKMFMPKLSSGFYGAIIGGLAHATVDLGENVTKVKMNRYVRDVVEGSVAGALVPVAGKLFRNVPGLRQLGGAAMGAAEIGPLIASSAVAYLTGDLAYEGSDRALKWMGVDEETASTASAFVGGAAGGAAFEATSMLCSFAAAAYAGAEWGGFLGLYTGIGGVALGLAAGAVAGIMMAGIGMLWHHLTQGTTQTVVNKLTEHENEEKEVEAVGIPSKKHRRYALQHMVMNQKKHGTMEIFNKSSNSGDKDMSLRPATSPSLSMSRPVRSVDLLRPDQSIVPYVSRTAITYYLLRQAGYDMPSDPKTDAEIERHKYRIALYLGSNEGTGPLELRQAFYRYSIMNRGIPLPSNAKLDKLVDDHKAEFDALLKQQMQQNGQDGDDWDEGE